MVMLHYAVIGNVIHLNKGEWIGHMAGVGAGLDSFYEYLLKVSSHCLIVCIV